MPYPIYDQFHITNSISSWLLAPSIIAAVFAVIGYLIATRRIKQPIAIFLARFGIVFLSLMFLEWAVFNLCPSCFVTMQNFTATLVGGILTLTGAHHFVSGSLIILHNRYLAFDITPACLGGELFWTYIALVIAETKASNKQRLKGIIIGLSILVIFNFLRIIISIYVEWWTDFRIHTIFYFFNMIFVLLVWVGWLRTLKSHHVGIAKSS